jgi:hypothetical protein
MIATGLASSERGAEQPMNATTSPASDDARSGFGGAQ